MSRDLYVLVLAALVSGCGDGADAGDLRALESLLRTDEASGSPGVAPVSLRSPQLGIVPAAGPTAVFPPEERMVRGAYAQSFRAGSWMLPSPCVRGALRWNVRPDRVEPSASATLRLWMPGQEPRNGAAPLLVTLARSGGSGKREFTLHGGGVWPTAEPIEAPILEGVGLEVVLTWDVAEQVAGLSVTDGFQRTLLDERWHLDAPSEASIGQLTLTLDGVHDRQRGKDPRLDLVLGLIEFWDLEAAAGG